MNYKEYVRPKYVELMQALGLECQFHRGAGSQLFYRDSSGAEVAVTDFLGGYGAALFGHNDPGFVDEICSLLREQTPFNAQMSVRHAAGELAHALSEAVGSELNTQDRFISVFSNSGAESVEVAVKHAEYRRQKQLQKQFDEIDYALAALENSEHAYVELDADTLFLPPGLLPAGLTRPTLRQLTEALRRHNLAQCFAPPVFVAISRSFHGKLVNTVQLTHGKQYRQPFARFGLPVEFLDPLDPVQITLLQERHRRHWLTLEWREGRPQLQQLEFSGIAAVLVEPIQGEGGINEFSADFYGALRSFSNRLECPLIVDEVQSGFGRTGTLLASSQFGLRGDYICLSKALGGGLTKIAVTLIRSSHYESDFSYIHSSTFAEDDISCRIALSALRRLRADDGAMLGDIARKGDYLKAALLELQAAFPEVIVDVRGRGLLLGLELCTLPSDSSLVQLSAQYNEALGYLVAGYLLQHEALRVAPSGSNPNVIRLEPPACISCEEIDRLTAALWRVCDMIRRRDALPLAAAVCADLMPDLAEDTQYFCRAAQPDDQVDTSTPVVARVAFINHLIDTDMISEVDPSLAGMSAQQKAAFIARTAPERRAKPIGPVRIRSRLGTAVEFTLYPLCMDSKAMAAYLAAGDLEPIRREISDRIRDARADGCTVAGLGMYTSIVTNNCQALRIPGVALTSGNALTVGMGLEAIERGAQQQGIDMSREAAAVVGAAGNIASTYAALLSMQVDHLILVGSGRDGSTRRLDKTAGLVCANAAKSIREGNIDKDRLAARMQRIPGVDELLAKHGASADIGRRLLQLIGERSDGEPLITITSDPDQIHRARIVVCAANAPQAFLRAEHFAESSVVCDIAVPLNVEQSVVADRPDVVYMHGGIVQTPLGDGLPENVRAWLGGGQLYACMTESVLMGLTGMRQHFSFGDIRCDQVREITSLAHAHGFRLAAFKTGNSL